MTVSTGVDATAKRGRCHTDRYASTQADGRVVIAGTSALTSRPRTVFGLARLNGDGSLDSSFGNAGTLTTEFFAFDQVFSVVVQPDGNIIAVGQTVDQGTFHTDLALARYLGN